MLGLGPRFMSVYIHKFGVRIFPLFIFYLLFSLLYFSPLINFVLNQIEQRIHYDEFEGLGVEWLEATSTLVLDLLKMKRIRRKVYNMKKLRPLEEVALVMYPPEPRDVEANTDLDMEKKEPTPAMFPLVVRLLSTVPVALHAIGGEDGPLDISTRLYTCSYFG